MGEGPCCSSPARRDAAWARAGQRTQDFRPGRKRGGVRVTSLSIMSTVILRHFPLLLLKNWKWLIVWWGQMWCNVRTQTKLQRTYLFLGIFFPKDICPGAQSYIHPIPVAISVFYSKKLLNVTHYEVSLLQSPTPGVPQSTLCATQSMWTWVSLGGCGSLPSFMTVFWHSYVYANANNKTLTNSTGRKCPWKLILIRWPFSVGWQKAGSASLRLVQWKKKVTPASELPGLSLSPKAISSNRQPSWLQGHLGVSCTGAGPSRYSRSSNHDKSGGRVDLRALSHGHTC